ncbi:MAG: minor capsid protein [Lachnospiraceae bacterium]|nr:minor capsid protein [Ruminococcus sp.]MCM1276078.1 minor capsid protein [Lachnospiraceae bacterium]
MNIKPIPDILLGDSFTLLAPNSSGGWSETKIQNVRVERKGAVSDYSSQKARDNTELTVWYDFKSSSPKADFAAGMRVLYRGETYEITEQRVYIADKPHHCKFKARKIGGEYNGTDGGPK